MSATTILKTIITTLEAQHLLPEEGTIVVAVSGGADSLCLLHILHQLCGPAKRYPTLKLHVAHLNHQLRGTASTEDALAIATLAQDWQLPYTIGAIDVSALARQEHCSLEDAARRARYRFLRDVAQGATIAVAHHKDDQVETLLLHWLRGGGLASMPGLQLRQQDIIRPLLPLTHAETLSYCSEYQLVPLEDASNDDPRFLRNRVRHELLPLLTSLNPGIRETLLRNAEVMSVDLAWLEKQVDLYWPEVVTAEQRNALQLHLPTLLTLPLSLQRHLLRRVTARLNTGQSPLELRHYRLIEAVLQRKNTLETLTLHLPHNIHLLRTATTLRFVRVSDPHHTTNPQEATNYEIYLPIPGQALVPTTPWIAHAEILAPEPLHQVQLALQQHSWDTVWRLLPTTPYMVYVDADRLTLYSQAPALSTLRIRTRRDGDRIQPLGMLQEKKIQDILVDKQVPRAERHQVPLFFSADHCIWLAGVQIDERVRLRKETQRIIRLSITQTET